MSHFPRFTSRAIPLPLKDVDTDMIIPARFLTTTTKAGLGKHVFDNLRKEDPQFPFNQQEFQGAQILIAGHNFGCGSSREHAPWALTDWGIKAIISSEFADIFRGNAEKNNLLPLILPEETIQVLMQKAQNLEEFTIDLQQQTVSTNNGTYNFKISQFSKMRFLEGMSDLEYLLKFQEKIREFEKQRKQYTPHI